MAISIIIPSTGERTAILLETIAASLYAIQDIEAEIIVIKKSEKYVPIVHSKLRLVDVDFNNVSASRNLGAKLANYDTLFFIDDDINIVSENIEKCAEFEKKISQPYVVSAIWNHSQKVIDLQNNTFLGQMLAMYFHNDSYKTRYKKVATKDNWRDNACFKSSAEHVFWEPCFSIRRDDYLRVGGMNELFYFGNEGTEFLRRLLNVGVAYYIDSANIVSHNEWDKFNDWRIPEKRWQVEAELVNDGKSPIDNTKRNFLYKLVYGTFISFLIYPLRTLLHNKTERTNSAKLYFKLFDVYLTSIYWRRISWKTLWRQPVSLVSP